MWTRGFLFFYLIREKFEFWISLLKILRDTSLVIIFLAKLKDYVRPYLFIFYFYLYLLKSLVRIS
jgi:hypothetical protein